jgi:tryptophan synthase alpha chain
VRETNRLDTVFENSDAVYMAHVYYGDPIEEFSIELIRTLCANGTDIIEFGIPFSDPTSDGPSFQRACARALERGMTVERAITAIRNLRDGGIDKPIVVTSYYNVIHHMGDEKFIREIKEAGADGLIIPNVPLEESGILLELSKIFNLHLILIVSPTTSDDRLDMITQHARGFLYVTAVSGVTGVRDQIHETTLEIVKRVRKKTSTPIVVGFGISNLQHTSDIIAAGADGVITGSAICRIYEKFLDSPNASLNQIEDFAKQIKQGCREGILRRSGK